MAHITEDDVQAWVETSKLEIGTLEEDLEGQISERVLARVSTAAYDVTGWTNSTNTPKLIKSIIAMQYAGWLYDRQYSESADTNEYALRLKEWAESLIQGIIDGTVDIGEVPGVSTQGQPLFFPTDASSANGFNEFEAGDGPASFSMGARF